MKIDIEKLPGPGTQRCALLDFVDYIKRYPNEKQALQPALDALMKNPWKIFNRTLMDVHITSSMMILDNTLENALVIEHVRHGNLLVPGGHVEGGTTLESAMREAEEEVSIRNISPLLGRPLHIDLHEIAARPVKGEDTHRHLDFMHLGMTDRALAIADKREVSSVRWMPLEDLAKLDKRIGIAAQRALEIVRD